MTILDGREVSQFRNAEKSWKLSTVVSGGKTAADVADGDRWRARDPDLSARFEASGLGRPGPVLPGAVPVLSLPLPLKMICCALSDADHIVETGRPVPKYPTLFAPDTQTP